MADVSEETSVIEQVQAEVAAEQPPAAAPEPAPTPAPSPPPQAMVPHAALHARLAEIQELRREIAALKASQAPKPEMPPDASDPVAYLHWRQKQDRLDAERRIKEAEEGQTSAAERQEDEHAFNIYAECADDYRRQVPDFQSAYLWLQQHVDDSLRQQGTRNPFLRQKEQQKLEMSFVKQQIRAGNNPAAAMYAKAYELGWRPAAAPQIDAEPQQSINPQPQPQQNQSRDPQTGQFVAQPAPKQPARSLSQAPGGAKPAAMTAEQIANMSKKDFDKLFENGGWERLHGAG